MLLATTLPRRVVHRPPCDELITGRGIDEFGIRQRHLQRGQQLLTMIVSLEAIFLSTFVTISQNRADEKTPIDSGPAVANSPGRGATNETLLRLSNEILALTKEIHAASTAAMPVSPMGEDH